MVGAKKPVVLSCAAALMTSAAFVSQIAQGAALPRCSDLAAELLSNSDISAATSAVVPAAGATRSYCSVKITVSALAGEKDGYLPGQKQQVKIGIGLPLSTADGGFGGVQGAWNGRIQDIGGGGYAGSLLPTTQATTAGFAGSSTDTGHSSALGGSFALNPDGTLNWGLIRDFAFNGIHAQSVWTKKLVQMYYGMKQQYAYWTGCSTGGRQGHQQAQKYPTEYDGILAGDPAFNWDRFVPATLWPQVVIRQEAGGPISEAKLDAAKQAAIAACDGLDGINDGIVQDPRACHFSARSLICTGASSDPATCLTPGEASAINKIWDGVVANGNKRLWFGLERGTALSRTEFGPTYAAAPSGLTLDHFKFWVKQDPSFDWQTLTEASFIEAMEQSEVKFHDVIGTDDPDLSAFKKHGGKMITYHGLADAAIFPRGTFNYYNRATERAGGLDNVQRFYRFFLYPGASHCTGNIAQPNAPVIDNSPESGFEVSPTLFNALINWVEHGIAPESIVGYNNANPALATVSRPICKYPDRLVYNGNGSTNDAANFHCRHEHHDPLFSEDVVVPDLGANNGNEHHDSDD